MDTQQAVNAILQRHHEAKPGRCPLLAYRVIGKPTGFLWPAGNGPLAGQPEHHWSVEFDYLERMDGFADDVVTIRFDGRTAVAMN